MLIAVFIVSIVSCGLIYPMEKNQICQSALRGVMNLPVRPYAHAINQGELWQYAQGQFVSAKKLCMVNPEDQNVISALCAVRHLCALGNNKAQHLLAALYKYGVGVQQNNEFAVALFLCAGYGKSIGFPVYCQELQEKLSDSLVPESVVDLEQALKVKKRSKHPGTSPLASPAARLAYKYKISNAEARALLAQRKKAVAATAPAPISVEEAYESEPIKAFYRQLGLFDSGSEEHAVIKAIEGKNYKALLAVLERYEALICPKSSKVKIALNILAFILKNSDVPYCRGPLAILSACGEYDVASLRIRVGVVPDLAERILKKGEENKNLPDSVRADLEYARGYIALHSGNKKKALEYFIEAAKFGSALAKKYLEDLELNRACSLEKNGEYRAAIKIFETFKEHPKHGARAKESILVCENNLREEKKAREDDREVMKIPTEGFIDLSKNVERNQNDVKKIDLIIDLLNTTASGDERRKSFLQKMKQLYERNNLKLPSKYRQELDRLNAPVGIESRQLDAVAAAKLREGAPAQVGEGLIVPREAIERLKEGEFIESPDGMRIERMADGKIMVISPDGHSCDLNDPESCASFNARPTS